MKTIMLCVLLACSALLTPPVSAEEHRHRRPDDITQYLQHLDSAERDQYQKPAQVMEILGLHPGMAVADLGSGSGYFTRRFVEAVTGKGMVYAVDVEPDMLAYVQESLRHLATPHAVRFLLARPDNPGLPDDAVDLIFVCNTVHHLEDRVQYFRNVRAALRPGGRIAIIDFYHDERSGELGFPKRHLVSRETVIQEMTDAGYRLERDHSFLPRQYFLEFTQK